MNIAVLIKMVPDTESRLEITDGKVKEDGFKYMVNPYDEFAVEQAVQFKEAVGGKVTLVSLFSDNASIDTDLRKMMAIGEVPKRPRRQLRFHRLSHLYRGVLFRRKQPPSSNFMYGIGACYHMMQLNCWRII